MTFICMYMSDVFEVNYGFQPCLRWLLFRPKSLNSAEDIMPTNERNLHKYILLFRHEQAHIILTGTVIFFNSK